MWTFLERHFPAKQPDLYGHGIPTLLPTSHAGHMDCPQFTPSMSDRNALGTDFMQNPANSDWIGGRGDGSGAWGGSTDLLVLRRLRSWTSRTTHCTWSINFHSHPLETYPPEFVVMLPSYYPNSIPKNPLWKLRDLDKASPQFHEQLSDFFRGEVYRNIFPGLQNEDLALFVEYLDSVSLMITLSALCSTSP